MKACQQLQQLFCSRENQFTSRFNQQNEKSTSKQRKCVDGDCTALSVQNPIQIPRQSSEDWNGKRQDQLQRNYYPPNPQCSPSYDIPDRCSEHYKTEEDRKEGSEFLNDKDNLDYYSSSESDSELEHKYETLI